MKKMKKSIAIMLVLILALVTAFTGCGSSGSRAEASDDDTVYEVKWAHVAASSGSHQAAAFEEVLPQIEEASGGRLKITAYGDSTLGSELEIVEGVQQGTIEMANISTGSMCSFYPGILATSAPFLFESREEAWELLDGEVGQWLANQIHEQVGVLCFGFAENGVRDFTANKELRTPEDFKGLLIRTQSNQITMDTVTALGATPTVIAFGELYTALQQGAADAQENPPSLIGSMGFYEVQDYIIEDEHSYDTLAVIVNEDWFNSLPSDLQEILEEYLDIYIDTQRQASVDLDEYWLEKAKEAGCTIVELTDDEKQAFKDATAGLEDSVIKLAGQEAYDKVMTGLEKIRNN